MAKPKDHVKSMFLLSLLLWLLGISVSLESFVINLILTIFFGAVIPDLDHVNYKDPFGWVIKFVKHEKVALPKGTKLWMHTFSGLTVVVVVLILFGIYFPMLLSATSCLMLILAFMIHMVIDGANRANKKKIWQNEGAYLPWFIHNEIIRRFCPQWLLMRITYYYNEGKKEEDEEKEEEQKINIITAENFLF